MPLTFDSCVALLLAGVLAVISATYLLFFEPFTRVLLQRVRYPLRKYYVRLVQLGAQVLFRRAFKVQTYGQAIDPTESALLLVTHVSVLDYFLLYALSKDNKIEHVFFFVYGQCVRSINLRALLMARRSRNNWSVAAKDVAARFAEFHAINQRHKRWVVMFPEVEMFSEQKLREHAALCYTAGAPVLTSLLYPRFAGVVQGIELLRTSVTAVYLLGVRYRQTNEPEHQVPSLGEALLSGELDWTTTVTVWRFAICRIPRTPKKIEKWLEKHWFKMDRELAKKRKAIK